MIYVDADACPVKAEVERVGTRHKLKIFIVSNGGIRPSQNPFVETVVVPDGPDIADMWIADRATVGDVVITGDVPLADKCIANGALVLKHNGEALTQANIGNVLATRDLMADVRAADPFRQGGGRPFSKADRARFLDALERTVRAASRLAATAQAQRPAGPEAHSG
ncbi:MAG: YaiI/YqxD family protein [Pseudomonadota bacterium]